MRNAITDLFALPFKELMAKAVAVHRTNFPDDAIQLAALVSVKTGGCPEDCAYCPQSARYATGVARQKLMLVEAVVERAVAAKARGVTRLCLGAAWRSVRDGPEFDQVLATVREVNALGLEVCCTLGMLNAEQARRLKEAGAYAYNHNLDTSRRFYPRIISTRTYDDRLATLAHARNAGLTLCTGGILGMGEDVADRIDLLAELAQLEPESVTINALIAVPGTPLENRTQVAPLELAGVIAVARCALPKAMIRLSAGRDGMSEEAQLLCFLAGANSIFFGETLLTAKNPPPDVDTALLRKLGIEPMAAP
jgi:biotin synthase